MAQQKPAAQLLLDRVEPIAHGCLRHLREQCLGVEQQQPMQFRNAPEFVAKEFQLQPEGVARALHHGAIWRRIAAHEHGDAHYAVTADNPHLGRGAVLHGIEQRHDCGRGEVDVRERLVRLVDHLSQGESDRLQSGLKATQNVRGKRREQVVLLEIAKALVGNHFAIAVVCAVVLLSVRGPRFTEMRSVPQSYQLCTVPNI